jgi:translation initiation factor 2 subunit 1
VKKKDLPNEGELVLATITKIQPHCAWVSLDEYEDLKGMVHISEIASSWVRNIRNFIHDGQHLVCRVLGVDQRTTQISLSIKRVTDAEKRRKMEAVRKAKRSVKLLEFASKKMGVDFKKAYETVGKKLEDEFGDLNSALEHAARGNNLPLDAKWNKVLGEIAKKNVTFPTYEISRFINIMSEAPDGINKVKDVLLSLKKKGAIIKYISAPKYKIKLTGENRKQTAINLEKMCEETIAEIKKLGGTGELIK